MPVIDLVDDDEPDVATPATAAGARGALVPTVPRLAVKDGVSRGSGAPPRPPNVKPAEPSLCAADLTPRDLAAALAARATSGLSPPTVARLAAVLASAVVEEEASGAVALAAPVAETADRLLRDYPRTVAGQIPWGVLTAVRSALAGMQAAEGGRAWGLGVCARDGAPGAPRAGWPPRR